MKHRDQNNGSWSFSSRPLIGEDDSIRPRLPEESDHRDHTMSFIYSVADILASMFELQTFLPEPRAIALVHTWLWAVGH